MALAVSVPFVISSGYWVTVLTTLLINVILVAGLNFMIGYAGLLNLGYAAFAGLGAYGTTLSMQDLGLSFWPALVIGSVASLVVAVVIALPTLRLSIVYLAIVTLAFGSIFTLLIFNLQDLTGGAAGIGGIPRPTLFGLDFVDTPSFYCLVLGFALVLGFIALRFERSQLGRAFKYVREDETAAEASGIDTIRTKLLAWGIGATYAAIGGALTAVEFQAIGPDTFDVALTFLILTMLVVGGSGSLPGVALGAALFTLLPEVSRSLDEYRLLIYGAALTAVMLVRPEGVLPARWRTRSTALPDTARSGVVAEPPQVEESRDEWSGALAEVRDLTKHFEGLVAVDGVSFTVNRGEILSIIGPNGAGKTTLIDMVCGSTRPTSGTVLFRGQELRRTRPSLRARRGLGRTFQQIRLFPELTVLENVLAGCHPVRRGSLVTGILRTPGYKRGERRAVERAQAALEAVGGGLAERADELPKHLPYGLQKRVELARALATDPILLVLDEPASGLNSSEKDAMVELIVEIRDSGTGVVLIEHDMALVMNISDRVIVLENGRQIVEGLPADVQRDERVIEAYLGREVSLV